MRDNSKASCKSALHQAGFPSFFFFLQSTRSCFPGQVAVGSGSELSVFLYSPAVIHLYSQSLSGYKIQSMLLGLSDVAWNLLKLNIIRCFYEIQV